MADREFTVERLSLQIKEEGEGRRRVKTVVVSFTAERVTWQITIARAAIEQIKVLFDQLNLSIFEPDSEIRNLVVEKDLIIDLDPRAVTPRPRPTRP